MESLLVGQSDNKSVNIQAFQLVVSAKKKIQWSGEMTQQVKVGESKLDDLSLTSGIQVKSQICWPAPAIPALCIK